MGVNDKRYIIKNSLTATWIQDQVNNICVYSVSGIGRINTEDDVTLYCEKLNSDDELYRKAICDLIEYNDKIESVSVFSNYFTMKTLTCYLEQETGDFIYKVFPKKNVGKGRK